MSMPMPWEHEDPLTQALYSVRMRGAFYSWTVASGHGAVAMPQIADTLSFHIVARGSRVHRDGRRRSGTAGRRTPRLGAPGNRASGVDRAQRAPALGRADELPQTMLGDSFSILSIGDPDDDELLALLCGVIAFDAPSVHDLLAVLPPVVRVDSARHPVMVSLLAAARGGTARPASGRRRGRDPARRRARGRDSARMARRRTRRRRRMAWRPCAILDSGRPWRRCTATRGTAGRSPGSPGSLRCRAHRSPRSGSVGGMATTADLLLDSLGRIREIAHQRARRHPGGVARHPTGAADQHDRLARLAPQPRDRRAGRGGPRATTPSGRPGGWRERFALPLPADVHGYGMTFDEVLLVQASAEDLRGYLDAACDAAAERAAHGHRRRPRPGRRRALGPAGHPRRAAGQRRRRLPPSTPARRPTRAASSVAADAARAVPPAAAARDGIRSVRRAARRPARGRWRRPPLRSSRSIAAPATRAANDGEPSTKSMRMPRRLGKAQALVVPVGVDARAGRVGAHDVDEPGIEEGVEGGPLAAARRGSCRCSTPSTRRRRPAARCSSRRTAPRGCRRRPTRWPARAAAPASRACRPCAGRRARARWAT